MDPKLALELQKLGHCALDNVIPAARRIERLQKDYPSQNVDNLVTVLQDELKAVCKELKESSAAAAGKAVCVAQPVAILPELVDIAAGRYVALAPGARTPFCHCRSFLCNQKGHFIASCYQGRNVQVYATASGSSE